MANISDAFSSVKFTHGLSQDRSHLACCFKIQTKQPGGGTEGRVQSASASFCFLACTFRPYPSQASPPYFSPFCQVTTPFFLTIEET